MSLTINSITKYFDEKCIFENFSYSFPENGIYALVGKSGIGKTTLLRIIASLEDYSDGNVIGGGSNNVSFAFQEYRLFPQITALDNVVFAIYERKDEAVCQKAKETLVQLGLSEEDINLFPSELSGGMKQRVSLARAFLKKAPILLLDEPTKELDEKNASIVKTIIREISKERLVILVTHNPDDIIDLNAIKIEL